MSRVYDIANSLRVEIEVGDWVDIMEGIVPNDPVWGQSFEVVGIPDAQQVVVLMFDGGSERVPTPVDAAIIIDNYRKVPFA